MASSSHGLFTLKQIYVELTSDDELRPGRFRSLFANVGDSTPADHDLSPITNRHNVCNILSRVFAGGLVLPQVVICISVPPTYEDVLLSGRSLDVLLSGRSLFEAIMVGFGGNKYFLNVKTGDVIFNSSGVNNDCNMIGLAEFAFAFKSGEFDRNLGAFYSHETKNLIDGYFRTLTQDRIISICEVSLNDENATRRYFDKLIENPPQSDFDHVQKKIVMLSRKLKRRAVTNGPENS